MADIHHDHIHETSTYHEERNMGTLAGVILALAVLIGFLIWLFAFNGTTHNSTSSPGTTVNINQSTAPQNPPQNAPQQYQQPQQQPPAQHS